MKPFASMLIALLACASLVRAQEEEEDPGFEEGGVEEEEAAREPEGPAPDGAKLLNDLTAANVGKDVARIEGLTGPVGLYARSAKNEEEIDAIARQLTESLKICKKEHGAMLKVVDALGALRSDKGAGSLERLAFKKKTKDEQEEELQAHAILAVARLRDTRQVNKIGDQTKSRSDVVAKAAYEAFKEYGTAKGSVRKGIAELLMKRLDAEYPSKSSGGAVSAAQQERWGQLSPVIVASLQAVCHEDTINDIENWREWWRENKKSRDAWKDD